MDFKNLIPASQTNRKVESWHDYLLGMAMKVKSKSKDPSTQVGAVIVDENNFPVSWGYNGFVKGCDEDQMTWERDLKYHLVIHAEMNAISFADRVDLTGCKMYIVEAPCDNCLKHVLQKGIREIYYGGCGIMKRAKPIQKEAIRRLVKATNCVCKNVVNGKYYVDELFEEPTSPRE